MSRISPFRRTVNCKSSNSLANRKEPSAHCLHCSISSARRSRWFGIGVIGMRKRRLHKFSIAVSAQDRLERKLTIFIVGTHAFLKVRRSGADCSGQLWARIWQASCHHRCCGSKQGERLLSKLYLASTLLHHLQSCQNLLAEQSSIILLPFKERMLWTKRFRHSPARDYLTILDVLVWSFFPQLACNVKVAFEIYLCMDIGTCGQAGRGKAGDQLQEVVAHRL